MKKNEIFVKKFYFVYQNCPNWYRYKTQNLMQPKKLFFKLSLSQMTNSNIYIFELLQVIISFLIYNFHV